MQPPYRGRERYLSKAWRRAFFYKAVTEALAREKDSRSKYTMHLVNIPVLAFASVHISVGLNLQLLWGVVFSNKRVFQITRSLAYREKLRCNYQSQCVVLITARKGNSALTLAHVHLAECTTVHPYKLQGFTILEC